MSDAASARSLSGTGRADSRFERLCSVDLEHEYYDGDDGALQDLDLTPTTATLSLIRNLGLAFRTRPDGVDLFYDRARSGAIFRKLTGRGRTEPLTGDGMDTRFTFVATSGEPRFAAFTDMPLAMSPGRYAAYVTNRNADGDRLRIDCDWRRCIRPINRIEPAAAGTDPRPPVEHDDTSIAAAEVRDAAGVRVLRVTPDANPDSRATSNLIPDLVQRALRDAPSGLYALSIEMKGEANPRPAQEFLHLVGGGAPPIFVLDLYLADEQDAAGAAACPVQPRGDGGDVTFRRYLIRLQARRTVWAYHVVAPPGLTDDLSIERASDEGPEFQAEGPVVLPTGVSAQRFVADRPWPVRRRSDVALRLRASRGPNGASRVLMERMPAPAPAHLRPSANLPSDRWGPDVPGSSDIYVHL